jgi:DNA-binding NarL/FixJ family response regulator
MPEMDGLELAKKVKTIFPTVKIIALSMNADGNTVDAMVNDADISGYLLKQTGANELVAAIERFIAEVFIFKQKF